MKKMAMVMVAAVILVMGISMTVKAANGKETTVAISNEEYKKMEQEYKKEVQLILLEKGCKDAGITLTYVTDADCNREYTITVHHGKLEKMQAQEMALMQDRVLETGREMLFTNVVWKQL